MALPAQHGASHQNGGIICLVGLMPWHLFENSWMWTTRSPELNRKISGKTYVPRLIIPSASIAPAIIDALIYTALILTGILMAPRHSRSIDGVS